MDRSSSLASIESDQDWMITKAPSTSADHPDHGLTSFSTSRTPGDRSTSHFTPTLCSCQWLFRIPRQNPGLGDVTIFFRDFEAPRRVGSVIIERVVHPGHLFKRPGGLHKMAAMDLLLGPILLGTIINIWLYGIMFTQTAMYFVAFPRDHRWIKILVTYMFTVDTLNSVFDIGLVWKYTITLFGDYERILVSSWWFNLEPVMTVMVSSSTQCFFAWRIAKLTGHAWMGWAIAFSAFVQFIAGTATAIGTFIVQDFARFQELRVSVIIWLALSALTDVVITCILTWYLHTHRTGFSKTDDVITRLVRLTVQTGLITTVWATTDLIVYLCWSNNMHLLFQLPLCKLYTNSLMSTLNSRAGWGGSFSASTENPDPMSRSGGDPSTGQPGRKGTVVWRPDQAKSQQTTAIQIVTTATVHRDDGVELEEYSLDTKRVPPEDIETLGQAQSRVKLPGMLSGTAVSDEVSMDSRASFDAK
ncbi:hypothetical protein RSAG8_11834, partial [Rhizoctonia solani AG-8 WAC10335]